ncbi:unnamed protein product, partial [Ectocarpus sp. 12 AP-2014]
APVTEVCDEELEEAVGATTMPLPVLEELDSQCAGGGVSNSSTAAAAAAAAAAAERTAAAMRARTRGRMKPGVEPRRTPSTPVRYLRVARGDGGRYQGWRTPSTGAGTGVAAPAAEAATPATAGAATRVVASARAP